MKKFVLFLVLSVFVLPVFAYGESNDDTTILFVFLSIVSSILSIILFFKIWNATNDIRKIKQSITGQGKTIRSQLRILHYSGKDEEAFAFLNKCIAEEYERVFLANKGIGYFESQKDDILRFYTPLYTAINKTMPDEFCYITYDSYESFAQ